MKIKAFHAISGGEASLHTLLRQRELLPASERMDPLIAGQILETWLKGITQEQPIPAAKKAVVALAQERINEISSTPPYSRLTKFDFEDLLSGDFKSIFLSVGGWHQALDREEVEVIYGFSFDATHLVDAGGVIRRNDLIDDYWNVLSSFLFDPGQKTVQKLKNGFQVIQQNNEIAGSRAKRALKRDIWDGYQELVFPGTLPLEWALEIYEHGVARNLR